VEILWLSESGFAGFLDFQDVVKILSIN